MGLGLFRGCTCAPDVPAPNPNPSRWSLLAVYSYQHAYVLVVKYDGVTNFEGVKVMVYRGAFVGAPALRKGLLDPHFSEDEGSPVARFRPDAEGLLLAKELAAKLRPIGDAKGDGS